MRGYRILVLGAVALCVGLMAPAAAHAEDETYPPPAVDAPPTAVAGAEVPFSGTGFMPFSEVAIDVTYSGSNSQAGLRGERTGQVVVVGFRVPRVFIKNVTTDADGAFATTIPVSQSGTVTITGSGVDPTGAPHTLSQTVVVSAPSGSGGGTGTDDNTNNSASGGTDTTDDDPILAITGMSGRSLAMNVATGVAAILVGGAAIWLTAVWRRRSAARQH